jgi:hypothetical protein
MDQETQDQLAALREQFAELRAGLGAPQPDQAEQEVADLRETVTALVEWAQTVTPAFTPPGGS